MNKSMRSLVFVLLFAAAGFGAYTLMNKSAVAVDENSQVTADFVDTTTGIEQVAQADVPTEEVIGEEGEVKVEEIKKDGEVAPVEEETEEVEETSTEDSKL
jgi:hypothetical protein